MHKGGKKKTIDATSGFIDDNILVNLRKALTISQQKLKETEEELVKIKNGTKHRKLMEYESEIQKYYLEVRFYLHVHVLTVLKYRPFV